MAAKTKFLFFSIAGIALALQIFQIDQTLPATNPDEEFHVVANPPDEIVGMLKHACYDCHSNNTRYPWYASVQPVGWWLQSHVNTGRSELNFSEFGRWSGEDQADVLRHCAKLVKKGAMPPKDYLRMHDDAILSEEKKSALITWLLERADVLENPHAKAVSFTQQEMPRDTCDDPDGNPRCCFIGMPDKLTTTLKIAPDGEPGQRLVIKGYVYKKDGKTPCRGVLLYAYHTDATGAYTRKGDETGIRRRHGRLHAWARTDAQGRYAIESIKPASYPKSNISAHIHAVVWEPGKEPYYIPEFEFAGDPFLAPEAVASAKKNPGRSGIISLGKDAATGILTGRRDIVLK
ncbi:MAG: heme-binding domain-containing protein [Saprospiraceae bacterium]|jgi:protocatechuate 3,4-dioxygenase beta subunit|nr:heme-binding domain-containing protein [Saprospiraceae bacterium]